MQVCFAVQSYNKTSHPLLFLSDIPAVPRLVSSKTAGDSINLTWSLSAINQDIQLIDHYVVHVDEMPPVLVKNTSVVLSGLQEKQAHHIVIRAVDECSQEGRELIRDIASTEAPNTSSPSVNTDPPSSNTRDTSSGAHRG